MTGSIISISPSPGVVCRARSLRHSGFCLAPLSAPADPRCDRRSKRAQVRRRSSPSDAIWEERHKIRTRLSCARTQRGPIRTPRRDDGGPRRDLVERKRQEENPAIVVIGRPHVQLLAGFEARSAADQAKNSRSGCATTAMSSFGWISVRHASPVPRAENSGSGGSQHVDAEHEAGQEHGIPARNGRIAESRTRGHTRHVFELTAVAGRNLIA